MGKLLAEFLGAFMLVLAVCGSALFSAEVPQVGAGILGVALAAGLAAVAMGYAVGHVSGGHFNPAVTCGLWAAGRFETAEVAGYIGAQVAGGVAATVVLYLVSAGKAAMVVGNFAANGYGVASPGGFALGSVFLSELILTALFVVVVCGATSSRAPAGLAPVAVGMALAALYVVSIPVSNGSLNPARSTASALFGGGRALAQLWLFWLAPMLGGLLGGFVAKVMLDEA